MHQKNGTGFSPVSLPRLVPFRCSHLQSLRINHACLLFAVNEAPHRNFVCLDSTTMDRLKRAGRLKDCVNFGFRPPLSLSLSRIYSFGARIRIEESTPSRFINVSLLPLRLLSCNLISDNSDFCERSFFGNFTTGYDRILKFIYVYKML